MKSRSAVLALATLLAAAALAVVLSQRRMIRARHALASAHAALVQTARDATSIGDLRARSQTIETRQRPAQDVIAQVNAALVEVGIPTTHLQSLAPEGDSVPPQGANPAAGSRLRQQSIRMTLQSLEPRQVGSFLTHWHSVQKVWSAARLELVHNNATSRGQAESNRYDATIVMTALYLAEPRPASPQLTAVAKERP